MAARTARSDEPHVWRTRAEHEVETWVLVDETASMDFGTVDVGKSELAAWVTGAVGLLSDGPGNRLGTAHLAADGLTWAQPLPSRAAAHRALRHHAMLSRGPHDAALFDLQAKYADVVTLDDAVSYLDDPFRKADR